MPWDPTNISTRFRYKNNTLLFYSKTFPSRYKFVLNGDSIVKVIDCNANPQLATQFDKEWNALNSPKNQINEFYITSKETDKLSIYLSKKVSFDDLVHDVLAEEYVEMVEQLIGDKHGRTETKLLRQASVSAKALPDKQDARKKEEFESPFKKQKKD